MKRRDFIGLACGTSVLAATTPRAAWAVEPHKMYRIVMLHPSHPVSDLTENGPQKHYREFFHELRRLGYIEGKNLVVERFSGEGRADHYAELAREAAARNPNVIFVVTNYMAGLAWMRVWSFGGNDFRFLGRSSRQYRNWQSWLDQRQTWKEPQCRRRPRKPVSRS
jgi:hypothetical protein